MVILFKVKHNSENKEFSKSLLSEIGVTGTKANSSLSNLNQTIISSILNESKFLSSLAIDIMDRNLYERANDCRWWALTSYFREAFDDTNSLNSKKSEITSILKYINDLYTVYTNLLIFDENGKVIAVSNQNEEHLVGKILTDDWVDKTFTLSDTSKYCVSKFEKTSLYNNKSTYIYSAGIRSLKDSNIIKGGIAVVFDSTPQFNEMLEDTLPKNNASQLNDVFAIFADRNKKIISSTNSKLEVNASLNLDDEFFKLKNGENISKIVEIGNSYFAVGVKCSTGYREYKGTTDDYKNDIFSIVFIKIGNKQQKFVTNKEDNPYIQNLKKKKMMIILN